MLNKYISHGRVFKHVWREQCSQNSLNTPQIDFWDFEVGDNGWCPPSSPHLSLDL